MRKCELCGRGNAPLKIRVELAMESFYLCHEHSTEACIDEGWRRFWIRYQEWRKYIKDMLRDQNHSPYQVDYHNSCPHCGDIGLGRILGI